MMELYKLIGVTSLTFASVGSALVMPQITSTQGWNDTNNGTLKILKSTQNPSIGFLGFGLDMTVTSPVDIKSAAGAVKDVARIFSLNKDTKNETLPGVARKQWTIPTNVDYDTSNHNFWDDMVTYENGDDAADEIAGAGDIGFAYKVIQGSPSISGSLKHQFHHDKLYALYAYNYDVATIKILKWMDFIDEDALVRTFRGVPEWPKQGQPSKDTVQYWRDVFSSVGSHIIDKLSYGSRLEVIVRADNSNSETNKNIAGDVKAYLQGLPAKGSFDGNVTYTNQYKVFSRSAETSTSCSGGDSNACQVVKDNLSAKDSYKNLAAWQATARDDPDLTYFGVVELWSVLKFAKNAELQKRELDTQRAFSWLVTNPQVHMTSCDIVINSEWAEIKMVDPESDIVNVEEIDKGKGGYSASTGSITYWTKDGSVADNVRIRFQIRNDGSPISIILSHSSAGVGVKSSSITFRAHRIGDDVTTLTNDSAAEDDPHNSIEYNDIRADSRAVVSTTFNDPMPLTASNSTSNPSSKPVGAIRPITSTTAIEIVARANV